MRCPSCAQEIPDAVEICPHCGARQSQAASQTPQAAIYLRRTSQYTAVFTKFEVFIDDRLVGIIENDARQRYQVDPGVHILHLKVDDFTSKRVRFSLDPGESIHLVCKPKFLGLGVSIALE